MIVVLESMLPIFVLVFLGHMLRRREVVPQDKWDPIEKVCFWLFMPAMMVETLIKSDLKSIPLGAMTFSMLLAVVVMAVIVLLLKPVFMRSGTMSGSTYTSVFQTSTRWNAFIALAIILKLFDVQGVALVAVAIAAMVPLINFENVLVLAAFASDKPPPLSRIALIVIRNPLIWGCIIGLTVNLMEVPVWDPVMTLMDLLGRSALGVGLLCVGAGLRIRHALQPSFHVLIGVFMKLIAMPILVGALGLAFGLTGVSFHVAIVCAAVPTAMNGYMLARQMGGDAELYAATAAVQTMVSFVSIPLFLVLADYLMPLP